MKERERIIQRPFEERGLRGPTWDQLYQPSWETRPSTEPTPEDGSSAAQAPPAKAPHPLREEPLNQAAPSAEVAPTPAVPMSDRYVLLASIWESGAPPPGLAGSNGLVALAVPVTSALADAFKKGEAYRFQSDGYTANYECLEVFATPQEAFGAYPEGMEVSTSPATFLHWREPSEPAALSPLNWSPVNS